MIVSSFVDVKIQPETLVLCDIDETLLKFETIDRTWWKTGFEKHYQKTQDYEIADVLILEEWKNVVMETDPTHTDLEGFKIMLDRIHKTKSQLLFVTARSADLKEVTKEHFKTLGVSSDEIYFCGTASKGEVIQQSIELDKHKHVVFIDDHISNIEAVQDVFGSRITCYQFVMGL